MDTVNYTDLGVSNWIKAATSTNWTTFQGDVQGGSFHTGSSNHSSASMHTSQSFEIGTEDLNVNVTEIVEEWIKGTTGSYGFGIFLTSSQETEAESYYTKKFFARGSEYFHRRPVLEARWNDVVADDSSNFYLSSSRAPSEDNLNTLYFYNYIRGQLVDIPSGAPSVRLFSGSTGPTGSGLLLPKGGDVASEGNDRVPAIKSSTGIYSASFAFNSSSITTVYPVWVNNSDTEELFTGSAITVKPLESATDYPIKDWVINITNLKTTYSTDETATFRLYVRPKNWNPNLYTVAQTQIETTPIEKAYYKLDRVVDNFEVVSYGTGSGNESYTQLSYDASGNYFDLDMSMLQSGYSYQLTFLFNLVGEYSDRS